MMMVAERGCSKLMGILYTSVKHPTKDKRFRIEAFRPCEKCDGKMLIDGVKLIAGKANAIFRCKKCLKVKLVKLEK
jgi:hypothetical protein